MKNININNSEMLMEAESITSQPVAMAIKRFIDIVGGIILLIITSPIFLVISIMIKNEGGSILFLNKRLGRGGKEFYCLKFRTMIPNAEQVLHDVLEKNAETKNVWETHRKIKDDPRVTRFGNFLRKSSLDELPQLINIIKGEMSLVGPRPILPDEARLFEGDQLEVYYSVRPGLTGLWQVSGRNNTTFKQRVELDTLYVTNWSIFDDFVILFKTFFVIIKRSGAY